MNKSGIVVLGLVGILVLVVAASGCTGTKQYSNNQISFSYPNNWTMEDFSTNTTDTSLKFYSKEIFDAKLYEVDDDSTLSQIMEEEFTNYFTKWNQSTINGNTVVQGINAKPGSDNTCVAIIEKNKSVYMLEIYGYFNDYPAGFKEIVNSFKIK